MASSLDLRTRTKTQLQTEAKILAGDSEGTSTSLWTSTETAYAADAAYAELMGHLLHKRHPVTRFVTYHNTAVTNPVTTIPFSAFIGTDIEAVHIEDDGADLSTGGTHTVLNPIDWQGMSDVLHGPNKNNFTTPKYYWLASVAGTASEGIQVWVGAVPETAGTNSLMIVSYGIQDWADADPAPFPAKFDQLFVNICAQYLRLMKDLSIVDLERKSEPLYMRLIQAIQEPRPDQDYQMPTAGRMSRNAKFHTRMGRIVRS